MALHTELPIHRTGVRLLDLAIKAQVQMPRTVKRALGEKITQHCVDMLDLMALANATQHETRAEYIGQLLAAERAITVLLRVSHDARYISPKLWAESIELLGSIGKSVLLGQLARKVTEPWWMALASVILMHDPRQNVHIKGSPSELALVPPHKSLFNAPDGHGLPIGNLSSQFFANVLLDDLDQFAKHRLPARHYVRYVDDFVLLHDSPQWLNQARQQIEAKLADLHLVLNPRKTILQPVARGIDFVGQVIKPWRRITRRRTMHVALDRLQNMPAADLHQSGNSYFGLLTQASHSHADRALVANLLRKRGHVINGDLTKTFRRKSA